MLQAPAASREKYPAWVSSHTERRKPRRIAAKTQMDDDGCREYSIIACVHGCGAEIPVLSSSFSAHKNQAIDDHLAQCTAIRDDERPLKKHRGGVSMRALLDPTNEQVLQPVHAKCRQEIDDLKTRMTALEEKTMLYDRCVTAVLPSIVLPLASSTGELQLRDAISKDFTLLDQRSAGARCGDDRDSLLQELARERQKSEDLLANLKTNTHLLTHFMKDVKSLIASRLTDETAGSFLKSFCIAIASGSSIQKLTRRHNMCRS